MYGEGGLAYVYFCYGIHHLFNVVTHSKDTPHAILIRSLEPVKGIETMLRRTGRNNWIIHLPVDPEMYPKPWYLYKR